MKSANELTGLYLKWFYELGSDAGTKEFEDYLRNLIRQSEQLREIAYESLAKDFVIQFQKKCLEGREDSATHHEGSKTIH